MLLPVQFVVYLWRLVEEQITAWSRDSDKADLLQEADVTLLSGHVIGMSKTNLQQLCWEDLAPPVTFCGLLIVVTRRSSKTSCSVVPT